MKIRKLFVLFLVFALLIIPGCLQKPEAHCCLYKYALNDECYFSDKLADDPDYTGEEDCKIWKENDGPVFCEVGGFNYSVCSEWEIKSCVEGCSGMLCGDFGKIGIPAYISGEDLQKGNIDMPMGQGAVFGLLHAECDVVKMTPSVENAMSKGLLLNSFRFGIGDGFDEYDNYRYLFPLSDKLFNSYAGTKDRYSNYFFAEKKCRETNGVYSCTETGRRYSSFHECEWECRNINPAMVCSAGMEEFSLPNAPFGNELGYAKHWYGGLFWADVEDERKEGRGNTFWSQGKVDLQYENDGRTANVGVLKFAKEGSGLTAATIGIFGFKEIPTYYANVLPRHTVYNSQIFGGKKAEFECESGFECYSGICGKDVYKRSGCIDALANNIVECGCSYEYGQLVCKPTRTASVPASDEPKSNVNIWDGEVLGVSKALPENLVGIDVLLFTAPEQISQPKASVVNGKVMIFLSRNVRETIGAAPFPLPNEQATRWAILHYCQIVPKEWSGCQEGGTYVINFVKNCMGEEYKEDIAVCYPPKFGLDGSSLGEKWREICDGLTDDDFCLSQGENLECSAYASAAIVIRKNENGNFGKCMADDNGNPSVKEFGWCEPATFNTIAVEHLYPLNKFYDPVGSNPQDESLPINENGGIPRIDLAGYGEGPFEDFKDDYHIKDEDVDEVNKRIANYCPLLEILPPSNLDAQTPSEWEGTTVGDVYKSGNVLITGGTDARFACGGHRDSQLRCDAYNLAFGCKDATRKDGDVYDARVSWPDFYPHWKYMKEKLTSYLIAGVLPVLYAEDDELYKTYYGCDDCYLPEFTIYKENATFAWKLLRDVYVSILYGADYKDEYGETHYAGDYEESASSLGPIIVVIGDADRNYEINLEKRASEVKEPCPYCMPALSSEITLTGIGLQDTISERTLLKNFDEAYGLEMSDHLEGEEFCSREMFIGEHCNSLMENTDILTIEVYIDPKVSLGTEEEKIKFYEYIVQKLSNVSRKLVYRFGKPSLLMIKEIRDSSEEYGVFNYLASQKARLVNSGIIGIHLSNFNISTGSSLNMQKYCSVEGSAEISAGLTPYAFVNEVEVSDECKCVECDEMDMLKGICNGYYLGDPLTGFQCSDYSGNQKWPEDCITEEMCLSSDSGTLKCRVYSGGKYSFEEYSLEEVMKNPSLYSDLIASLKGIPKICVEENTKTFSSLRSSSPNPMPILFSTSGNESKECVKGGTYANFCGFDIPLKTRVSECWVEQT